MAANRKCLICDKEFYLKLSAIQKGRGKYCSKACSVIGQYKKVKKECGHCGREFSVIPHKLKLGLGKFCSRACSTQNKHKQRSTSNCLECKKEFFVCRAVIARGGGKYCSQMCQFVSMTWRRKIGQFSLGEKSYFWRGGLTEKNYNLRKSPKYQWWRREVFKRDDYTCQMCGQRGGRLEADHIKPWSLYPELRFDVNNGRTLCKSCHKKTDTYGIKALNYERQVMAHVKA